MLVWFSHQSFVPIIFLKILIPKQTVTHDIVALKEYYAQCFSFFFSY